MREIRAGTKHSPACLLAGAVFGADQATVLLWKKASLVRCSGFSDRTLKCPPEPTALKLIQPDIMIVPFTKGF